MTKLNITNKTIYKLKKNKNQSKKNVPKKRKYKKRKHKNGRSFRKRRRKYNIKNNSIKKYKKQRGGAGEIDKTTAKSKDDKDKLKQLEIQQRDKEEKIKIQQEELLAIKERQATNKETQAITKVGIAIVGKLDEDSKKLKNLNNYKDRVKQILIDERKKVKKFKTIKGYKKKIYDANNRIKEFRRKQGEIRGKIDMANKAIEDIVKQEKTLVEGQKKDSLDGRKKQEQDQITEFGKEIEEFDTKIKAQTIMINNTTDSFIEKLKEYYKERDFEDRPQTIQDKQVNEVVEKKDTLNSKINALKVGPIEGEKDEETIRKMTQEEKKAYNKQQEEAKKKYYEAVKDQRNGNEIVDILVQEQKWISTTEKEIKNRDEKVEVEKTKNEKAIDDVKKKEQEEQKEQEDKISKEKEEKDKIKENIVKKEAEMKHDEKEWQKTQDEATKTIEKGETVFKDKIEKIADEDDRTIEDVKQDITNTEKELKSLKSPGLKASKADKDKYQNDKKKITDKLEELKKEYNEITKGEIDKLKKPGRWHRRGAKDEYKKKVEGIEKETLEDKKKSIESRGARKNWAKVGLAASKILHTNFKLPMITDHITDDMVEDPDTLTEELKEKLMRETENYRLLHNTPYISSDGDDVYARADKPTKPNFGKPFYNYYLKKTIKTPDGELQIFEMIEQRKMRYIKWLMRKKSGETYIQDLTDNIKIFEVSSGLMRNTLKEKIITLTFLAYIISRTDEVYIHPLTENPTEEEKKEHEEELKASKFERAIKDLHKTTIDGKTLFELFCIYVPEYTNTIDKKLTQDVLNSVNKPQYDKVISIGENDFLNDGLKSFNDYKFNHSDCGVLEENDDNDNYLNIGLSNFSNIDNLKQWVYTKKEDKGENMVTQFKEAQTEMNNAKEKEDEKLKELVDKIKKIIEDLKIDETGAKIVEMEEQLKAMRTNVKGKQLKMQEGHAEKLEEQKQKYEKEAKKAEQDLAVKEGLLKEQEKDMTTKQEEIEKLQTDLEAQNEGLKTCKEGDAAMRAEFESKKADLEGKINLMKEEKMEMEKKMNDLETAKEDAVKVQKEYKDKIIETEKREVSLRKDIEASKTPIEVTEETLIDGAEDDEDNSIDAAFDAMEGDGGLNIDIDEKEPLMIFLTQKNGELEVVTSKLPGNDISSWLMQE